MDTLWSLGRGTGSWSSHGNGFGACGSGLAMLCRRSQAAYGTQKSFLFFYGHEELTAWHLTDATAMNDNAIEPRALKSTITLCGLFLFLFKEEEWKPNTHRDILAIKLLWM
jgi:hypothetical protein